ncbi:MAG: nucleotidyltransferase family protein [Deltaproteobacteria bacterium]|nr:nucleotidyltransferase family protein [Deltaproteobacteria bacterium]
MDRMVLSKEEQLLLALARMAPFEQDARTIQGLLKDSLDWSSIMEMADFHGIAPLMYWHLKQDMDNSTVQGARNERLPAANQMNAVIPFQVRNDLRRAYDQNLVRNKILFSELKKILTGLNAQGIQVIVLKGALFARMLYGDPALRRMSDIDILVKPADFDKVAAYLVNAGYARSSSVEHLVRERRYHHTHFVKGAILIEVHKGLAQPRRFKINLDHMWKRSIRIKIDGVDALRLSNEDTVLHLCLHMAYHKFLIYLFWWTDLYEFIKKFAADIDWRYVVEKAIEQRIKTSVYFSLYFVKRIMKAEIPAFVFKSLAVSSLRKKIIFLFLDENKLNLYKFAGKPRGYQLALEFFLIDRIENQLVFSVEFVLRSLELCFYKWIPQITRIRQIKWIR